MDQTKPQMSFMSQSPSHLDRTCLFKSTFSLEKGITFPDNNEKAAGTREGAQSVTC